MNPQESYRSSTFSTLSAGLLTYLVLCTSLAWPRFGLGAGLFALGIPFLWGALVLYTFFFLVALITLMPGIRHAPNARHFHLVSAAVGAGLNVFLLIFSVHNIVGRVLLALSGFFFLWGAQRRPQDERRSV